MSKLKKVETVKLESANGETLHKFEVQIDILPAMIIEAVHQQEAIDYYFKFNGIISTEDRINIKRLDT